MILMAIDPRAKELAQILTGYSLDLGRNDVLLIRAEDKLHTFAEFLGKAAYERGVDTVIYAFINLADRRALIDRNDKEELGEEGARMSRLAEASTAALSVAMFTDPLYLKGIAPEKIADFDKLVSAPYSNRIVGNGKEFEGIKWVVAAYPTRGQARLAGMNFKNYKDFVYNSTNIDWSNVSGEMKKVKETFDNASEVHITGPKTDIRFSLEGRGGDICDGRLNMPDGEVYYGPVEDSMNGRIYFPYECIVDGNSVKGISLEYVDGEVVSGTAEENQAFLDSKLAIDGAKRVGEFGIGCNYGIDRYTNRLLFDEKIGGTIHLAIGKSYPVPLEHGGGKNVSDIHWDLVCDLRKVKGMEGGRIFVDDELVQENGIWNF